jgi:hypothetical protein
MTPYEFNFKNCTENGIRIYPVPVKEIHTGEYYIVVERNGLGSKGTMIFKDKTNGKENNVWQQIELLYKIIYEKEIKPKTEV